MLFVSKVKSGMTLQKTRFAKTMAVIGVEPQNATIKYEIHSTMFVQLQCLDRELHAKLRPLPPRPFSIPILVIRVFNQDCS